MTISIIIVTVLAIGLPITSATLLIKYSQSLIGGNPNASLIIGRNGVINPILLIGLNKYPPSSPIDFIAVLIENDEISAAWITTNVTWIVPEYSDNITVVRKLDRFPSNLTDGDIIYNGIGTSYNDTIIGTDIENVYYAAWAENIYGLSSPATYLLEVKPKMVNAILLIGIMIVSLFMSAMGYYFKKVPITVIASLLWLGTSAWSFTQVVTSYDIYFVIGCVGVLMGILSAVEPFIWVVMEKKNPLSPEEQENEIDRQNQAEFDETVNSKKRKRRPY